MKTITPLSSPDPSPHESAPVPVSSTVTPSDAVPPPPTPVVPPEVPPQPQLTAAPQPQPSPAPISIGAGDAVPIGVAASSLGLNGNMSARLPIGIYIIAGLTFLNFLAVFFNTNTSAFYSITMVFDLLVAIGLFTKIEMARQAALYVQILSVIVVAIVIIALVRLDAKVNQDGVQFNQAISRFNVTNTTPEQRTEIAALKSELNKLVTILDIRLMLRIHVTQLVW